MIDGVIIKIVDRHPDERGFFEELIRVSDPFFSEGFGQLSRSLMHEGVVKAWHVHKSQIDWWYIATGTVKVALYDTRNTSPTKGQVQELILGEEGQDAILKIPSGVAHGCKVLKGPSNLIYVTSSMYSKNEEGRVPYDDPSIGYDWVQGKEITNKNIT